MAAKSNTIAAARQRAAATSGTMLFETARPRGTKPGRSLLFENPVAWLTATELHELPALFAAIVQARARGLWVAGCLSYECGYHWEPTSTPGYQPHPGCPPLAAFGVYREPVFCSASTQVGPLAIGATEVSYSMSPQQFAFNFERVQNWIAAGDTYQVNLTFRMKAAYPHGAAALFTHMMHTQPVEFGAMLNLGTHTICSASPELFFHQQGRAITVRPMKGTSPRGRTPEEDDRLARALAADEKNRAENVMIVDLLRNDLGRIAETGSVHVANLFAVERHPSLLQMTSEVHASLRREIDEYRLFAGLFPSGSIVGAPKIRTMQLIRALEQQDRGPYTGAIGFFSPNGGNASSGEAVFSVAIRTAVLSGEQLTMGIGAGITSGSSAQEEYEECLLKSDFLRDRSFGLIETMRWENGRCDLLEDHLNRLAASAKHFRFHYNRDTIQQAIAEQAARLPPAQAAVTEAWKLRFEMNAEGTCTFTPPQPIHTEPGPFQAAVWPVPVRAKDHWLRHKTTRRKLYDDALQIVQQHGCIDAIFLNEHGIVTEGAIHSIFVRHGTQWRTPPIHAGVLPGIFRTHLLRKSPHIREEEFDLAALHRADEIWLTNSVRGIRTVTLTHLP